MSTDSQGPEIAQITLILGSSCSAIPPVGVANSIWMLLSESVYKALLKEVCFEWGPFLFCESCAFYITLKNCSPLNMSANHGFITLSIHKRKCEICVHITTDMHKEAVTLYGKVCYSTWHCFSIITQAASKARQRAGISLEHLQQDGVYRYSHLQHLNRL